MEPKIFKGKTVEEATEEALKTLETDLENLEIKIVDTGRAGILGLGGHPAEIITNNWNYYKKSYYKKAYYKKTYYKKTYY